MIRFSTLSRMSGFMWHSSKWVCRFICFLQYTSGLEVLVCSFDTNIYYVTTYYAPTAPFHKTCRCQKSKKGTEMECMKFMMENLFWTLKVVCQNIVIIFNLLVVIKVWQTRSLSHLIIPLLWDNYLVLTNSLLYLRKTS